MKTRRGAVSLGVALVAAALAQVVVVAACGEFGLESNGGDAAAPGPDGATPVVPDASAPDAPSGADAAAMSPPDASCGSHFFCANFESPGPEQGWSTNHVLGGGLGIAFGRGSPGNALNSSIAAADAPQSYAYLAEDLPGAQGIHLEVEMKVPTAAFVPGAVITLLQLSGDTTVVKGSGVGMVLASSQASPASLGFYVAHGDGTDETFDQHFDFPRDQWVHVVVDLRFGVGTGFLGVTLDAKPAIMMTLDTVTPATPQIRVGVQHYNGATPPLSVLYDTVRADVLQ